MSADQTLDAVFQLLPPQIDVLRARQVVQHVTFNAVDQLAWLAMCRNTVEKSPRGDGGTVELQNATGQDIGATKVIK